ALQLIFRPMQVGRRLRKVVEVVFPPSFQSFYLFTQFADASLPVIPFPPQPLDLLGLGIDAGKRVFQRKERDRRTPQSRLLGPIYFTAQKRKRCQTAHPVTLLSARPATS